MNMGGKPKGQISERKVPRTSSQKTKIFLAAPADVLSEKNVVAGVLRSLPTQDPPADPKKRPPLVFLSYCREDGDWMELLLKQLKFLESYNFIRIFYDRHSIELGETWQPTVEEAIEEASLAVCLLSPDYFASQFCLEHEVPHIQRRMEEGKLTILPVLLKVCLWDLHPLWSKLQMFTDDNGKHLVNGNGSINRVERYFVALAKEIVRLTSDDPDPTSPTPGATGARTPGEPGGGGWTQRRARTGRPRGPKSQIVRLLLDISGSMAETIWREVAWVDEGGPLVWVGVLASPKWLYHVDGDWGMIALEAGERSGPLSETPVLATIQQDGVYETLRGGFADGLFDTLARARGLRKPVDDFTTRHFDNFFIGHGKATLTAEREANRLADFVAFDQVYKEPEREFGGTSVNLPVGYLSDKSYYAPVDFLDHTGYLKNMITGAGKMDGALHHIDALTNKRDKVDDLEFLALVELLAPLNSYDYPELIDVEDEYVHSAGTAGAPPSARELGRKLFKALFPGDLRRVSINEAGPNGTVHELRLRRSLDLNGENVLHLAALPWELLYTNYGCSPLRKVRIFIDGCTGCNYSEDLTQDNLGLAYDGRVTVFNCRAMFEYAEVELDHVYLGLRNHLVSVQDVVRNADGLVSFGIIGRKGRDDASFDFDAILYDLILKVVCDYQKLLGHPEAERLFKEEEMLESMTTEAPTDPRRLSDLAAAYLVRAQRTDRPADLLRSLDAAQRAVAKNPDLPEARFNLALQQVLAKNCEIISGVSGESPNERGVLGLAAYKAGPTIRAVRVCNVNDRTPGISVPGPGAVNRLGGNLNSPWITRGFDCTRILAKLTVQAIVDGRSILEHPEADQLFKKKILDGNGIQSSGSDGNDNIAWEIIAESTDKCFAVRSERIFETEALPEYLFWGNPADCSVWTRPDGAPQTS